MVSLYSAIGRALRDLLQPRVLAVLVLPMVSSLVLWLVLAFMFWDAWTDAFRGVVEGTTVARWLAGWGAQWVVESLGVLVVIVLLLPATLVTAILITEVVAMPVVVSVAGRSHPALQKRSGGTTLGSIGNALAAVSVFALLWLLTLPLWLTGIGAVLLPALTSAWLNQKLFRYDALAEHASGEEYRELVARNKGALFLLGLMLAPLYYVPLVNLAAPVIAGLAFTHYCLSALAALRSRKGVTMAS